MCINIIRLLANCHTNLMNRFIIHAITLIHVSFGQVIYIWVRLIFNLILKSFNFRCIFISNVRHLTINNLIKVTKVHFRHINFWCSSNITIKTHLLCTIQLFTTKRVCTRHIRKIKIIDFRNIRLITFYTTSNGGCYSSSCSNCCYSCNLRCNTTLFLCFRDCWMLR